MIKKLVLLLAERYLSVEDTYAWWQDHAALIKGTVTITVENPAPHAYRDTIVISADSIKELT